MSKNVAVFVDVANIFYAAKAAGVDIDYVTLLKSATAGRDFVRAYAYTGLDPENENQRQFHSFLTRSGYKVISKDIRKYGDGRIKANLDIELVVDMMRMAEHLDIAVVISGDGDFAPAIRAVQQMGVRVEVVSFRGNTSSDLIEVADVFIDITHVARVEKGERSGRRVASEGDLSMTEVPDKETEGAARRRRGGGRRVAEPVASTAAPQRMAPIPVGALPGNVIVLPGERLSRAEGSEDEMPDEDVGDVPMTTIPMSADADGEVGRRRRRRGGRGRGRGRAGEGEMTETGEPRAIIEPINEQALESAIEEEEYLDEIPVSLPQHSTFGSVWDSQLGVPSAPLTPLPVATAGLPDEDDEDDEDEPEIPEYLLAERRAAANRQNRGRGGQGGARAGYRAAIDRERYGRGGAAAFGAGGNVRTPERSPNGNRGGRPGQGGGQPRNRPPFRDSNMPMAPLMPVGSGSGSSAPAPRPATGAEPWSEVPLEVQELLRAELARRQTPSAPAPQSSSQTPAAPESTTTAPVPAASSRRAPRTSTRSTAASAPASPSSDETPTAAAVPASSDAAPAAKTTRTRKTASPSSDATSSSAKVASPAKKPATRKAAAPKATAKAPKATASGNAGDAGDAPVAVKPKRRASTKAAATDES